MVDSEKIEDVNKIVIQHATSAIQFSSYYYFNVFPSDIDDFDLDMVFLIWNLKMNPVWIKIKRLD